MPEQADRPVVVEWWTTADGTAGAAYVDGRLEVGPGAWPVGPAGESRWAELGEPHINYASLASLPEDPRELIELLASTSVPRDSAAYNAGSHQALVSGPGCGRPARRASQPVGQ